MSESVTNLPANRRDDAKLIQTLKNSLYPGIRDDTAYMIIDYCRAAGLDVMMKPVHAVPMSVKNPQNGRYEWRDVIMPGINQYRINAERTGRYAGMSEPEFGPTVEAKIGGVTVRYPEWCRITVRKVVDGLGIVEFTAKEYWIENYATAGKDAQGNKTDAPNAMWRKRPFGQLAKCTEAQALRKAFPDSVGAQPTAEEMAGKTLEEMDDFIDVDPRTGEIKPKEEPQRTRRPSSAQKDADLASKLKGEAPAVSDDAPGPDEAPAEEQEPASDNELAQVAATIELAIGYIEAPADANEIMDKIKAAPLTSAQKSDLRKKVHARVKEITSQEPE